MTGQMLAVVPIRSLTGGKTRLASALTPEARSRLTAHMLQGVIAAALQSGAVARVIVVSEDHAALAFATAQEPRVVPLPQPAQRSGLIPALDLARDHALCDGAAGLLVIFGDLPLLDGDDIRNLVRRDAPVVLAPDRHGTGTNALLLRPNRPVADERAFAFQFGKGSFARHLAEAHRLGLDVATTIGGGTSFDLDTPEDLRTLLDSDHQRIRALSAELKA